METARKPAITSQVPHAPAPARRPPSPASRVAALQSRIGASGLQQVLGQKAATSGAAGAGKRTGPQAKSADGDPPKNAAVAAVADAASGSAGGGGAPAVRLFMPEAPTSPSKASQARMAGVRTRSGAKADAQATLPPPEAQIGDAQKAVTPPEAQRAAEPAQR